MATFKIPGVEIFSVGIWNGDAYTQDDLQCMIDAFNETVPGIRPPLKLGHDNEQSLLQIDGMPAAGWIERLYMIGDKLCADFCDIPEKIFNLIDTKAYRKVSSEIYWNLQVGEKVYQRFLGAVALLGADMPGVMNLADILGRYKVLTSDRPKYYTENIFEIKQKHVTIENEGTIMPTEKELQLEAELKTFKANSEASAKELEALKAETTELKKFKVDQEAVTAKALADAKEAQDQAFISELVAENLCTPAMKPFVAAMIGEEKKEYSVKTDKDEQKLNKHQLLKETLKLFKAIAEVNLEERSTAGKKDSKLDDKATDEKIKKYAADYNVSYGQATKVILKQQD